MIAQSFQIDNLSDITEKVQRFQLEKVEPCQYHNIDNVSNLISNNDNPLLLHLNIRSLQKHLDSLKELLHQLSIYHDPPTPHEINDTIANLKTKKSTGADEISSFFVRNLASVLSPYLCFLFSFAFEFGNFPNCLKIARVVPIHKAGSKKEVTNYRSISLLTYFSIILEKLIQNGQLKFCQKNNIFYNRQFDFRKNHSTIQAINDIVSQCYDYLN